MRLVKSGLTILFFALGLCSIGVSGAQAQTFTFQVCNNSKVSASVAVSNLVSATDNRFEVQGWWTVTSGTCENLGDFPQGWFYIYAEQTNTGAEVWEGDVPLCVQYPGPFEVIHTASITCDADNLKQFNSENIPNTTGQYTFTLN
jgi:uncharacterized membrane protein